MLFMSVTSTLDVKGMTCSHCAHAIHKALDNQTGIENVAVDLKGNQVTVSFNDTEITLLKIKEEIEEAGYDVVS